MAKDGRFKVTSAYDAQYGGGYKICIEDLNTGETRESWAYNKADIETTANRVASSMKSSTADQKEVLYVDGTTADKDADEITPSE